MSWIVLALPYPLARYTGMEFIDAYGIRVTEPTDVALESGADVHSTLANSNRSLSSTFRHAPPLPLCMASWLTVADGNG